MSSAHVAPVIVFQGGADYAEMLHVLLESEGFESSVVPVPGWPDQARIVVGWRRALGIRIFLARFVSEHEFPLE